MRLLLFEAVPVSEFDILDIASTLPVCLCVILPLALPQGRSHPHGLVPAAQWSSLCAALLCKAVCTGASGPCRHAAWPRAWGVHWQGVWRDRTVLETCDRRLKGPECLTLSVCVYVCVTDGYYMHINSSISVMRWLWVWSSKHWPDQSVDRVITLKLSLLGLILVSLLKLIQQEIKWLHTNV